MAWGAYGSPLPYGDPDMGTGIAISPYGNGDHRFHMGIEKFMIPVSIWGSPYGNGDRPSLVNPHFHMGIPFSIWGAQLNRSPFPYGDHHMEMGIDRSPYGNRQAPFPYRERNDTAPRFYMGITIWKRVPVSIRGLFRSLTRFHIEFVSIWGSR